MLRPFGGVWGYRSTVGRVLCKHLIRVRFSIAPRSAVSLVVRAKLITWLKVGPIPARCTLGDTGVSVTAPPSCGM
jgi:hypothetical protein